MKLYKIYISNPLDSSLRVELVASFEPLTLNSNSLINGLIKLNDYYNDGYLVEKIHKVEQVNNITINAWSEEEHTEITTFLNKII